MLLLAALIPPIVLIIFIWRVDPVEKESPRLVLRVFLYGALSGIVAGTLEALVSVPITSVFGTSGMTYLIVENYLGIALIEELVKMAVIARFIWRHAEFDHVFDGIVYAVAASLGFAALENIGYVFAYGGLPVAIARALTAIPGHAIFGVFMGALLSVAKLAAVKNDSSKCGLYLALALIVPVILHGTYDLLASSEDDTSNFLFLILLVIMWIAALVVVKRVAAADRPFDPDAYARRMQMQAQAQAAGQGQWQGQGYPQGYGQGQYPGQARYVDPANDPWAGIPPEDRPQMPADGQTFADLESRTAESLAHHYEE